MARYAQKIEIHETRKYNPSTEDAFAPQKPLTPISVS